MFDEMNSPEVLERMRKDWETEMLRGVGYVPGTEKPRKTLTLADVQEAMRKLREIPPMTPEQEERVREQLRGKKPGDYVDCDLFIGIMPDLDKEWGQEKFHPNRQCARCPRCYPEGKDRSPWCPSCQGVISKVLREQGLTLYCTTCNEKVALCACLEGK